MNRPDLICLNCRKLPEQLPEYVDAALDAGVTPDEYVWAEEGTLNPVNGHFLCTPCYIAAGLPTSPEGWMAP